MANEVTVHIKTKDDEARAGMKAFEEEAKHEGEKAGRGFKEKFRSGMKGIAKAGENPFANWGALIGGAGLLGGPLAGMMASVGAFSALAVPELSKVRDAMAKTGKAGQKAWAQLTPGEQTLGSDLKGLTNSFHGVQHALQPVIDHVFSLGAKLGTHLMPALEKLGRAGGKILEVFLKALDKLVQSKGFDNFVNALSKFGQEAAKSLTPALMKVIEGIMASFTNNSGAAMGVINALSKLITFLGEHATGVFQAMLAFKGLTLAVKMFNAASLLAEANPIVLIISGIIIVTLLLITHWKTVEKVAKFVWTKIKEYVADAIRFIKQHWRGILEILTGPIGLAVVWIHDHWNTIKKIPGEVVDAVAKGWGAVYHAIVDPVWNATKAVFDFFNQILNFASSIPSKIGHFLGSIGSGALHMIGFEHGGIVGAAATGGNRSGMVMVGEHGRELVSLPTGSKVHSNSDTERMVGGPGKGQPVVISFDFGGAGSDELIKVLRGAIRVKGGNVQTVLGH